MIFPFNKATKQMELPLIIFKLASPIVSPCYVDFVFSKKYQNLTCATNFICPKVLNARAILEIPMLETLLETSKNDVM